MRYSNTLVCEIFYNGKKKRTEQIRDQLSVNFRYRHITVTLNVKYLTKHTVSSDLL